MNSDKILEILVDWNFWGRFNISGVKREKYMAKLYSYLSSTRATVVKGVRRAGKSYLIYLLFDDMIKRKKILKKDTLIVNFEDPRFPRLKTNDLIEIYNIYLSELDPSENHIVALDEVQNIVGWEKFVRYLIENRKVRTIVTGSSSKLLSLEYATVLSGRYLDVEVFPLSFSEFLTFKDIKVKDRVDIISKQTKIRRLVKEYLEFGGFPEIVLESEYTKKRELLLRYVETIAVKDVVGRFKIREIEKLEDLIKIYLSNVSTLQSFSRLRKTLNISLDSVERFSRYLTIARLIFFVPKLSQSLRKQVLAPKKVYAIDTGFAAQYGFRLSENIGRIMENAVATMLIRLFGEKNVFYWKDLQQKEVDFAVINDNKVNQLIQVCYDIDSPTTKKREISALIKAANLLDCNNLFVITWDYENIEVHNQKKITFIPLWKWLLQL